jgi:DHA2 family multidrug resistance protein-like MFS transporter
MDGTIATAALPTIARELHVPASTAVLLVIVYQLLLAMTIMPFSALGDRIGHRRLYQGGLAGYLLGAACCPFANSMMVLVAIRMLQAVSAAAALSVAFGMIRNIYPLRQLGRGLGLNTLASALGGVLGPSAGGLIVAAVSWHWVFAAAVPLALLALLLSWTLPRTETRPGRFDIVGSALCAATFGLLIFGFDSLGKWPLLPSLLIVLGGAVAACIFVRHAATHPLPVLPIDLLARPPFALSVAGSFMVVVASMTAMLSIPFRLQRGYGFDPGAIGGTLAFYAVGSVMIAPASGILSDRIPPRLLCFTGLAIAAIALLLLAFLPAHLDHYAVAWRLCICGGGFGMFASPNARMVVNAAHADRAAAAGGMLSTNRMIGQATGATLLGALLAMGYGAGPVPALIGVALLALAAICCQLARLDRQTAAG